MTEEKRKGTDFNQLISLAASYSASDLHLISGQPPYLRVNGILKKIDNNPVTTDDLVYLFESSFQDSARKELFENKNCDTSYQQGDSRFRVNICECTSSDGSRGYKLSARIISPKILEVEEIGYPSNIWEEIVRLKQGLVLVTGKTGSGKSTTLASLIKRIGDTRSDHIITLEQPVEYIFKDLKRGLITQREIPYNSSSFADGVREAMRQDPNVMLVGEIRDPETANAAITAVETGHLVLATLHTSSAIETISRMAGLFPEEARDKLRDDLATTLEIILSQQLVPVKAKQGRVLAMEVLLKEPAVASYIRNKEEQEQLRGHMQRTKRIGNILMDDCLANLVSKGKITAETALDYSHHRQELQQTLMSSKNPEY